MMMIIIIIVIILFTNHRIVTKQTNIEKIIKLRAIMK